MPTQTLNGTSQHCVEKRLARTRFIQGLISVPLLTVVGALAVVGARKTSDLSKQAICVENLKQISMALDRYYEDHHAFPPDYPNGDFREDLQPYVPNCDVFICPCDTSGSRNSYKRFYIRRPPLENSGTQDYIIGCPRHAACTRSTNLFTGSHVAISRVAHVEWSKGHIELGQEVRGGVIRFEDGSSITLHGSHRAAVIQSISRLGSFYHIVRVFPSRYGSLTAGTQKGSRLDVLTPVAVIQTHGTRFDVTTETDGSTTVAVKSGSVKVETFSGRSVHVYSGTRVKVPSSLSPSVMAAVRGTSFKIQTAADGGITMVRVNSGAVQVQQPPPTTKSGSSFGPEGW